MHSIDPVSRNVAFIDKLKTGGQDIGGLTYDGAKDMLYASVIYCDAENKHLRSELVRVDMDNASLTVIGKIADGYVTVLVGVTMMANQWPCDIWCRKLG